MLLPFHLEPPIARAGAALKPEMPEPSNDDSPIIAANIPAAIVTVGRIAEALCGRAVDTFYRLKISYVVLPVAFSE